ncbi:putative threonine-rich GPI-anchored glycoprotein [Wickerhamomyces ciferrii]|uniref:Threonine-rich GPI-anchored glycoprotein n=1 Tax=Wickerhamomyces ciferrii (strain ATCC 14091 / BCRC 22168 / CBS 111 / JCM 3599 / NBRC 0793 / NRRL Y-1031 F-60-10) TaxID=1206466 RepID=K0KRD6_WICCF|nr:putative threonine-rich GPI-anchored glycoprotein [Wickerhamomyces ciferrii]CCH43873.1 putative threonine-rich GPI-anchored glycoprotein [Wickerhamomyces ciferrii]
MKSFLRLFLSLGLLATIASAIAAPKAEAIPWASANPHAAAAANAFADAYAEAIALAHPDPEAYAYAASADDCATIGCHASCGLLIVAGQECSKNTENTFQGPYNTTCLCSAGSQFNQYYAPCMNCGWTLWKYYGGYVSSALAACETLSTEPTGTLRCSTTLTDSYTIDTSMRACEYTGGCPTTTSTTSSSSTSTSSSSSVASSTLSSSSSSSIPSSTSAASTSSSTSAAVTSSSSSSTTSVYVGITNTVETDLVFTHTYVPGGSLEDCFTTTKQFPVATNNPIDHTVESWTEREALEDGTYKFNEYIVFKFNEDQEDITDIKVLTDSTYTLAPLLPVSEYWINLKQGFFGHFISRSTNLPAYSIALVITKGDKKLLYTYTCDNRFAVRYMELDLGDYDSCQAWGTIGYWGSPDLYCKQRSEAATTTIDFRPKASSSAASSSSVISSESSAVLSSSSVASSSAIASSSESSAISSESSVSSFESSVVSSDSSAISSESSVVSSDSSSISSSESSAVSSSAPIGSAISSDGSSESSAISSNASSESSAASSVASAISSESSAVSSESSVASSAASSSEISSVASSASSSVSASASSTDELSLDGELVNNNPEWTLRIPSAYAPWTSISIEASRGSVNFKYDSAVITVNGESQSVTPEVLEESITINIDFTINDGQVLEVVFGGTRDTSGPLTANVDLVITTADGKRFAKRATQTFNLSNTIEEPTVGTSSGVSSAASSVASSVSSVASSVSSAASSASSAISSASDASDSSAASSASSDLSSASSAISSASSAASSISSDVAPQSTSTTAVYQNSTTLVTVTSCDEDKCSEVPSTALISIATTTINGVVTSYTTYCPLTTTSAPVPAPTTVTEEQDSTKTTLVTVTSCHEDKCSEVVSTAQVSIATTTVNGIVTSYTTYCPLTTETGVKTSTQTKDELRTVTENSTKVITVTSCHEDKCSTFESTTEVPVTTHVVNPSGSNPAPSDVTSYINQVSTSYYTNVEKGTTVTSQTVETNVGPAPSQVGSTSRTGGASTAASTDVSTPVVQQQTEGSSTTGTATTAQISTFEGSASRLLSSSIFGLIFMLFI